MFSLSKLIERKEISEIWEQTLKNLYDLRYRLRLPL